MKRLLTSLASAATMLIGTSAMADPPMVIPYEGYLQYEDADGSTLLVDGPTRMGFTLGQFQDDGSCNTSTNRFAEVWSDTSRRSCDEADCRVNVDNGFFSVALGSHSPIGLSLSDLILSGEPICLVTVLYTETDELVVLDGVQTLYPRAYAQNVGYAQSLTVEGTMTVEGAGGQFNGGMQASAAYVDSANVTGAVNATTASSDNDTEGDGIAISGDAEIDGSTLQLNESRLIGRWFGVTLELLDNSEAADDLQVALGRTLETDDDIVFNDDVVCSGSDCEYLFQLGSYRLGDNNIFDVHSYDMGTATTLNTGISSSTFACWVSEYQFGGGDPQHEDSHIYAYTYQSGGTVWIAMDFRSHNGDHETHDVEIICLRKSSVQTTNWP